jgi:serine/threonine protein kinase
MAALEQSLDTGTTFGRYTVASRLAVGGMATVWLARLSGAEGFEKEVVIKTMLAKFSASPDLTSLFVNEATIAARFNHPNIVQVFDFGCRAGHHYMVMEHVAGQSLRQIQRGLHASGEAMPHQLLLHVIVDVCNALQYAHDLHDSSGWLEFVHGDLSPENVMVSYGGVAKLIDFGAAHIKSSPRLTGKFIGKYRYTSPECLTGAVGDRRSDIYSLGVILYELLTGVRPFSGSDTEIIEQVRQGRPRQPTELLAYLPPDLMAITLRAMAVDPADRHQTAEELADDIAHFLHHRAGGPALIVPEVWSALTPPRAESIPAGLDRAESAGEEAGFSTEISIEEELIVDDPEPGPREEAPAAPPSALFDRRRPRSAHDTPDIFSTGRAAVVDVREPQPMKEWAGSIEPAQPREAARHFDRGFALVAAKRYREALQEWELALAGDPENRTYKTNVRRLREHVEPTTALDEHRG